MSTPPFPRLGTVLGRADRPGALDPRPGIVRSLLALMVAWSLCCLPRAAAVDVIWFDDALPAGAGAGGTWNWVGSDPTAFSGSLAHQTSLSSGRHEQWFNWAGATLAVNPGDVLFTHIFLDPANLPRQLLVSWKADTWEHRAYWGESLIAYGTDGTPSRRHLGPLPAAGQWVRLEVPADAVALAGTTLQGMSFALYDGRATWDLTGKFTDDGAGGGPDPAPSPTTGPVDDFGLRMPRPGDHTLHVLAPDLLELVLINTKQPDPARVDTWDWVDASGNFTGPDLSRIQVRVAGQTVPIAGAGFKRRVHYAPIAGRDLRIANHLYLRLGASITDGQLVEVDNDGTQWPAPMRFVATADPQRFSPAIHVNQEGYLPALPKRAAVGYSLGNLGEMAIPATNFSLVDAGTGAVVHLGTLTPRPDVGYVYAPTPYQKVYEADFSSFTTPGGYRLVVPGLGASLPFLLHDGVAMNFARTYALGLLHQRSGFDVAMPFTRFTHGADHTAPALVPAHAGAPFEFTWNTIARYATEVNSDNPPQTAPRLTSPSAQLYPFVNQGPVNASGGHFEAGNYSRVTWNCAQLLHMLVFAADALPGAASLDNLGLPESGDGIPDLLQEARWEAEFLARMQDADGGFYYTTYPINREYENDVLPENGDQEVVWPKNTAASAAAVAALAQISSSPRFRQHHPADAERYRQHALRGWQFLTDAIATHGLDGAYQRLMHFGDLFTDRDELAWAACEMFLATGEAHYRQRLSGWLPDPADPATFRWGWWRQFACYGNAVRSYAFAARSGRVPPAALDPWYLGRCATVITDSGDDNLRWSQQSAYGTSFPENTKHVRGAGWYFSTVQAFDLVVAHGLNPQPAYLDAILRNLNYEGGNNPVNATYLTGLGWRRQREIVDQYSANDRRVLPKTGIPIGNIQEGFTWTFTYGGELGQLTHPSDGAATAPYPFYDRWSDFWNVTTEHSSIDLARSLAGLAWLAAQTPTAGQAWRSTTATIRGPVLTTPRVGEPVTVTLQLAETDLSGARIVWEARDQQPAFGTGLNYTFTPVRDGPHWIEAEVQWPDGRRAFALGSIAVQP